MIRPVPTEEDYFKDSTMTFGEHLEELRVALFKAVIWLVAATLVGLYFGNTIVGWIQYPLKSALIRYYQQDSFLEAEKAVKEGRYNLQLNPQELKKYLEQTNQVLQFVNEPGDADSESPVKDLERLARERFLLTAAQRELDSKTLYTPQAFPLLPAELAEQAKKYAELSDTERTAFNAELLKIAFPERGKERVRMDLFHVDNYEQLKIRSLNVQEGFMIYLKASLLFGFIVSSPFIFYHLWQFVGAGLYPHEKSYVHTFLPLSLGLFFSGAALAFFVVFSFVLDYLLEFNRWLGIAPDPRINEWLGFALVLPLGFGISFQLPLVMLFLERIGIVTVETYREKWRVVVLVIFIASAILTPADPYSMLLMAIPMCLLYVVGLYLCRWWPKRTAPALPA